MNFSEKSKEERKEIALRKMEEGDGYKDEIDEGEVIHLTDNLVIKRESDGFMIYYDE